MVLAFSRPLIFCHLAVSNSTLPFFWRSASCSRKIHPWISSTEKQRTPALCLSPLSRRFVKRPAHSSRPVLPRVSTLRSLTISSDCWRTEHPLLLFPPVHRVESPIYTFPSPPAPLSGFWLIYWNAKDDDPLPWRGPRTSPSKKPPLFLLLFQLVFPPLTPIFLAGRPDVSLPFPVRRQFPRTFDPIIDFITRLRPSSPFYLKPASCPTLRTYNTRACRRPCVKTYLLDKFFFPLEPTFMYLEFINVCSCEAGPLCGSRLSPPLPSIAPTEGSFWRLPNLPLYAARLIWPKRPSRAVSGCFNDPRCHFFRRETPRYLGSFMCPSSLCSAPNPPGVLSPIQPTPSRPPIR